MDVLYFPIILIGGIFGIALVVGIIYRVSVILGRPKRLAQEQEIRNRALTLIRTHMSALEPIIACVEEIALDNYNNPSNNKQDSLPRYLKYLVLTGKRVCLFVVDRWGRICAVVEIPLSNVARKQYGMDENNVPYIGVTTTDGNVYYWVLNPSPQANRLVDQFRALIERQYSQGEMIGTASELEKLAELVNRGVLSRDDFDRAKGLMLGKPMSKVEEVILLLENLAQLHKQGVLSEGEFNMKKWDVLSR